MDMSLGQKVYVETITAVGMVISAMLRAGHGDDDRMRDVLAAVHAALCVCLSGLHQFTSLSPEEFGAQCSNTIAEAINKHAHRNDLTKDPTIEKLLKDIHKGE